MDVKQFTTHIVQPTLSKLEMDHALSAVEMMVGTVAVESSFEFIKQKGGGPAIGFFQLEPATIEDVVVRYVQNKDKTFRANFEQASLLVAPWNFTAAGLLDHVMANLRLQCAIARVKYWMTPEALPPLADIPGYARYWKKYYNTINGAGTEDDFVKAWSQHVGAI